MTVKKVESESIEELLRTAQQVALLIEDNNQNMKDCHAVLKKIQDSICPSKPSLLVRAIRKLLNKS